MAAILKKKIQKITKGEKAKMLSNPSLQKLKQLYRWNANPDQEYCLKIDSPASGLGNQSGFAQSQQAGGILPPIVQNLHHCDRKKKEKSIRKVVIK